MNKLDDYGCAGGMRCKPPVAPHGGTLQANATASLSVWPERSSYSLTSPNYFPIACAAHERLELAVMRRQRLLLTWMGEQDQTPRSEPVQALDVATRDGAEWLRIQRPDGQSEEVRLDRILAASEA